MTLNDLYGYGFQQGPNGQLFIPFQSTRTGTTDPGMGNYIQPGSTPTGEDASHEGQYFTDNRVRIGNGEYDNQRQYYGLNDYMNLMAPGGPDLSNIRNEAAGTNQPSYFSYRNNTGTGAQFGDFNGNKGWFFDPKNLGSIESSPGSAWNDFRDGPMPLLLPALGGIGLNAIDAAAASSTSSDIAGSGSAATSAGAAPAASNIQLASNQGPTDTPIGESDVSDFDNLFDNGTDPNFDTGDNFSNEGLPQSTGAEEDFGLTGNEQQPNVNNGGTSSNPFGNISMQNLKDFGSILKMLGGSNGGGNAGSPGAAASNNPFSFNFPGAVGGLMEFLSRSQNAGFLKGATQHAEQISDPFGPQRGFYQDLLKQSYENPSQTLNGPVFGGIRDMAINDTSRNMASRGYNMSGNEMQAIGSRLQDEGMKYMQPYQAGLGQLAGGNVNPGYSGLVSMEGSKAVANANLGTQGSLGNLFNNVNTGNQPSLLDQLFGGQSSNNTLLQTLGLN